MKHRAAMRDALRISLVLLTAALSVGCGGGGAGESGDAAAAPPPAEPRLTLDVTAWDAGDWAE